MDLSRAIARLRRHQVPGAPGSIAPGSFLAIETDSGELLSAHVFSAEMVVAYVVDAGHGPRQVTEEMRTAAGLSEAQLRAFGLSNLKEVADTLKFRRVGRRFLIDGDSDLEASLLLVDSFWDREELAAIFPNGPVAAIGASDILVVCDRGDVEEIGNLRTSVEMVWGTSGGAGTPLAKELYARDSAGQWRAFTGESAPPPPPLEQPRQPDIVESKDEAATTPPARPASAVTDAMRVARRLDRERVIAFGVLAGIAGMLALLSVLARHSETLYHLLVFVPTSVGFGVAAKANSKSLRHNPDIDDAEVSPEPTSRVVIGIYVVAALLAAAMAFGSWHAFDDVSFSGFERGGGTYVFAFAAVLGLVVVLGLQWADLKKPWDSVLHAVALTCGTMFLIASLAGTAGAGVSRARLTVFVIGLATIATARWTLRKAHPDQMSQRTLRVGLIAGGGATMVASSFFSWGGGRFIVNYVQGTQIGGLDGRITLFAGALVVVASAVYFLFGRSDPRNWVYCVRTTAVLSLVGLFGVLSRGLSVPHVGRTLAGAACGAVLLLAAGAHGPEVEEVQSGYRWHRGLHRVGVGTIAILAAALLAASEIKLGAQFGLLRDQNELLFAVTLGSIGFVLVRVAFGTLHGNVLAVNVGGLVFASFAALMLIPSSELGSQGLISGGLFAALALSGLFARHWLGGVTDSLPSSGTVKAVVRAHWRRAALAAVVAWSFSRWGFDRVVDWPDRPSGDVSREEYNAANRATGRVGSLQVVLCVGFIAVSMARARDLVATVLFATAGGLLFFELRDEAAASVDLFDENYWLTMATISAALYVVFTLGRGAFSGVAMMFTLVSVSFLTVLTSLFSRVLVGMNAPGVVLRELLWHVPSLIRYFAIALVFVLFPVSVRRGRATLDSKPSESLESPAKPAQGAEVR